MSPLLLATLCVSALYGWIAWRLQRVPSATSVRALMPLALLAHGALIFNSALGQGDIRLGFGNSLSTILWLTALTYWLASQGAPLARLQSWVSGLAGVSVLLMAVLTETHPIPEVWGSGGCAPGSIRACMPWGGPIAARPCWLRQT